MKHLRHLIDGDKYCNFLNTYPLEKAQNFMSFYRDALQKTFEFEVEAIPVEWIKEWMRKSENTYNREQVYEMLEEWEKENETV